MSVVKKMLVGMVLLALFCGGMYTASAASLGGLEQASALGASAGSVGACQSSGLHASWGEPDYSATYKKFVVKTVVLKNVAQTCQGKGYQVNVADSKGNSLGSHKGTLSHKSSTQVNVGEVDVEQLGSLSVVVWGD